MVGSNIFDIKKHGEACTVLAAGINPVAAGIVASGTAIAGVLLITVGGFKSFSTEIKCIIVNGKITIHKS